MKYHVSTENSNVYSSALEIRLYQKRCAKEYFLSISVVHQPCNIFDWLAVWTDGWPDKRSDGWMNELDAWIDKLINGWLDA